MAGLLDALLKNESGGRNVANTTQGTSSGQAQGYFQITTGTWNDFGGQQYAPTPLQATYEQQAAIASKIPLKRWDESTVAKMAATGKAIDPNRTLGENLAANGESFNGAAVALASAPAGTAAGDSLASAFDQSVAAPPPGRVLAHDYTDGMTGTPSSVAGQGSGGRPRTPPRSAPVDSVAAQPLVLAEAAPEIPSPAVTRDAPALPTAGLADLFTVGDIGQASSAAVDPKTGLPRLARHRRTYG